MPIVLNTNAAATEATFNLSKANDNLRRSISRLSSGSRITKPTDDAGGLAVAYKLNSSVKRTEAALNNHQNALSFLQVQDGVLEAIGDIVDRMAELRTMAADVSKNTADVENYSKEFLELQDQLAQMKREKFNGVELFSVEEEWHTMKGMNKSHLKINGADYVNDGSDVVAGRGAISLGAKEVYEYFDHPDESKRANSSYDKYEFELYTHPSGVSEDGSIKLNIVNLQFMLGVKDPGGFGIDDSNTWKYQDLDNDGNYEGLVKEFVDATYDLNGDGKITDSAALDTDGDGIADLDADGDGTVDTNEWSDAAALDLSGNALDKDGDGTLNEVQPLYTNGAGNTISISNTINLAGLNQALLDPGNGSVHATNNGTDYSSWLTTDGYVKDITRISIEEFTNIIEKIADVRAENGAEQARVNQSMSLHQNNLVNLQAAHGRIVDVDVAMESTRLARHSVTVQASAAMVAQANQMTAIALTLLSQ